MDDLVQRLRDYRERFVFQGGSEFAATLADAIERLMSERDEWELEANAARLERDAIADIAARRLREADEATRERDAARAALRKYGRHTRHCAWFVMDPLTMERDPCDCGFDAALAHGNSGETSHELPIGGA